MGELFGTDGVRGIPGRYPLAADTVRRIAFLAATVLRRRLPAATSNGDRPRILIGRDTRGSGPMLQKALARGFARADCRPVEIGVLPTPAMAYLVPRRRALAGVVISASHNPAEFNGIKFFTRDGFKMGEELEDEIERRLGETLDPGAGDAPVAFDEAARPDYLDYLRSTFPATLDLSGLKLVVDCANGASAKLAPPLLSALGAEVFAVGCKPDGSNINKGCGALDTALMRREVVRHRADAGICFDGDADRCIFADGSGREMDGDVLIATAAASMQDKGLLAKSAVVLTVMSNYGVLRFLESRGIRALQVPVGDRNVTEAIEREALTLGGESSGHIVFRRFAATGDGLLTALQILSILAESGKALSYFRRRFKMYPQILRNVAAPAKVPIENLPQLSREMRECERALRGQGRVLVRYSGTEPLIRIMLEGPDRGQLLRMSSKLAATFKREIQSHVD